MRSTNTVQPGDIIAASRFGYEHVGIVAGVTVDGEPTVVSGSKRTGRVVAQRWAAFAAGGRVRRVGYPGTLPRHVVVAQARAQIGQPWALLNNCEHVATRAHGVQPRSGQLRAAVAAAIAMALVTWLGSPKNRAW